MHTKKTMKNGVRLIYEPIEYLPSVTVGIWIKAGSRYENDRLNGISHFLEHMFFKGTKHFSAKQIADEIDAIGGQINAFTSKEYTCIYAKVLAEDVDTALYILSDMFYDSLFAQEDIQKERGVIFEEINMYEDSPEDMVHDLIFDASYGAHPFAYSVLGNKASLNHIDEDVLRKYYDEMYINDNIVLTVLGKFEEKSMEQKIEQYFGRMKSGTVKANHKPTFKADTRLKIKETEQFHLCLAFDGLPHGHQDMYSLLAVNNILGGNISSFLFQRIREELGLVYSIYSYPIYSEDTGLLNFYAGFQKENFDRLMTEMNQILKQFFENGVTEDLLARTKRQLKGSYMMGLESTGSRMNLFGKAALFHEPIQSLSHIQKEIDAISMASANKVISKLVQNGPPAISLIGNFDTESEYDEKLRQYFAWLS